MIRINLLPETYRKAERTSPKVFAAALIGVILACSGLGWFGMVYFGDLQKMETKHKDVTERLAQLTRTAALYDDLVREEKEFSKRRDTIHGIAKGRMIWTRFLDELITVVTNEGNYDRHVAWFGTFQVRGARDTRKGPSIMLPGKVQGSDMTHIANLNDDIEAAQFYRDMTEPLTPSAVRQVDKGVFPPESYSFSWKWQMVAPDNWVKNRVATSRGK